MNAIISTHMVWRYAGLLGGGGCALHLPPQAGMTEKHHPLPSSQKHTEHVTHEWPIGEPPSVLPPGRTAILNNKSKMFIVLVCVVTACMLQGVQRPSSRSTKYRHFRRVFQ